MVKKLNKPEDVSCDTCMYCDACERHEYCAFYDPIDDDSYMEEEYKAILEENASVYDDPDSLGITGFHIEKMGDC